MSASSGKREVGHMDDKLTENDEAESKKRKPNLTLQRISLAQQIVILNLRTCWINLEKSDNRHGVTGGTHDENHVDSLLQDYVTLWRSVILISLNYGNHECMSSDQMNQTLSCRISPICNPYHHDSRR